MTILEAVPVVAPPAGRNDAEGLAERYLQIPPVYADLLPPEVLDSRLRGRARRNVAIALAGCAVILTGWYGVAIYNHAAAADQVTDAESSVQTLTRQQDGFTEVVGIQAEREKIDTQLRALMSGDLPWATLIGSVRDAAPKSVRITGVTGSLNQQSATSAQSTSGLPVSTDRTPIGTLTITGSAATKAEVAAYVDALAKVTGVGDPLLGDVTLTDGSLNFTVRADLTEAAQSGRFTSSAGQESGKK
jgi:hypothetical protein